MYLGIPQFFFLLFQVLFVNQAACREMIVEIIGVTAIRTDYFYEFFLGVQDRKVLLLVVEESYLGALYSVPSVVPSTEGLSPGRFICII